MISEAYNTASSVMASSLRLQLIIISNIFKLTVKKVIFTESRILLGRRSCMGGRLQGWLYLYGLHVDRCSNVLLTPYVNTYITVTVMLQFFLLFLFVLTFHLHIYVIAFYPRSDFSSDV